MTVAGLIMIFAANPCHMTVASLSVTGRAKQCLVPKLIFTMRLGSDTHQRAIIVIHLQLSCLGVQVSQQ